MAPHKKHRAFLNAASSDSKGRSDRRTMPQYRLLLATEDAVLPISLEGNKWLIGRGTESHIMLSDPEVSRRHALLLLQDDELWIQDLGARNKTYINGEILTDKRKLEIGDRILLGKTVAVLEEKEQLEIKLVSLENKPDEQPTLLLDKSKTRGEDKDLGLLNLLADSLAPVMQATDACQLCLDLLMKSLPSKLGMAARFTRGRKFRVLAARSQRGKAGTIEIPGELIRQLCESKAALCSTQLGERKSGKAAVRGDLLLIAPLTIQGKVEGLLYLARSHKHWKSRLHALEFLQCIARILASRLETLESLQFYRNAHGQESEKDRSLVVFLATSKSCKDLRNKARLLAAADCPLTILGEPGVGKGSYARHVHGLARADLGERRGAFVVVDSLVLESDKSMPELFGNAKERCSFAGKLHDAKGGTLLIRNVDALSKEKQEMLVAALSKLGTAGAAKDNAALPRLMLTSHLEEEALIGTGRMLESLDEILSAQIVKIPPLRDRVEDIPLLGAKILDTYAAEFGVRPAQISPRALDQLRLRSWPGNVLQLQETLLTAVILSRGQNIYPKHLRLETETREKDGAHEGGVASLPSLAEIEMEHIQKVLRAVGGNRRLAAKTLGIANSTLYEKVKKLADKLEY